MHRVSLKKGEVKDKSNDKISDKENIYNAIMSKFQSIRAIRAQK